MNRRRFVAALTAPIAAVFAGLTNPIVSRIGGFVDSIRKRGRPGGIVQIYEGTPKVLQGRQEFVTFFDEAEELDEATLAALSVAPEEMPLMKALRDHPCEPNLHTWLDDELDDANEK